MNTVNQDLSNWEAFRNGDKEAFASIFREYYPVLVRYGNKLTRDTELLEDCIQELFLELWQSRSKIPVLSIRGYLLKSLKYKLLRTFRRNERSVPFSQEAISIIPGGFEWSHETFLIAQMESETKKQQVLAALARLSSRQKEIIYLKYYQNLSYEEVSEIMNINYQAARNLLYQAIKSLKNILLHSLEVLVVML